MERDKWIVGKEVLTENSIRRIFSITSLGKKEFKKMLRKQLADYSPSENPNMVSISFLDYLSKEEAINLLMIRLNKIKLFSESIDLESKNQDAKHTGRYLLPFHFSKKILDIETELLNKLIKELQDEKTSRK